MARLPISLRISGLLVLLAACSGGDSTGPNPPVGKPPVKPNTLLRAALSVLVALLAVGSLEGTSLPPNLEGVVETPLGRCGAVVF
jgi:hypothetical protein